jgi:hypothetical protein
MDFMMIRRDGMGWDDTAFRIAGVPFIYRQSIGFIWSWENDTKHTGLRAIKRTEIS